jgi:hypothetical protein
MKVTSRLNYILTDFSETYLQLAITPSSVSFFTTDVSTFSYMS